MKRGTQSDNLITHTYNIYTRAQRLCTIPMQTAMATSTPMNIHATHDCTAWNCIPFCHTPIWADFSLARCAPRSFKRRRYGIKRVCVWHIYSCVRWTSTVWAHGNESIVWLCVVRLYMIALRRMTIFMGNSNAWALVWYGQIHVWDFRHWLEVGARDDILCGREADVFVCSDLFACKRAGYLSYGPFWCIIWFLGYNDVCITI